jgi:nucleoside-diphosphate-sugar epimerase
MIKLLSLAALVLLKSSSTWAFGPLTVNLGAKDNSAGALSASSRRDFFREVAATSLTVGGVMAFGPQPMAFAAGETSKVLVLGGTGFVGSRVVQKLKSLGVDVVATSRDGRDGTVALDVSKPGLDVTKAVEELAKGCTAVISTIGCIGTDQDLKVNSATGLAAMGAKAAGVTQFVYISVAPEVKEFAKNIDFLKPYMQGKTFSEEAVASSFYKSTVIEPTFIYGGDSFNVNPPRVAGFYGEFIEALLSSGPIRAITNVAPEGLIKIALEPPVSVDVVANAAVAGALREADSVLDSYDKIVAASKLI